jgi:hypothetical protein
MGLMMGGELIGNGGYLFWEEYFLGMLGFVVDILELCLLFIRFKGC